MKLGQLALALGILFLSYGASQDFRNSSWGDTLEQVRAAETLPEVRQAGSTIVFKGEVHDLDAQVVYAFLPDGRLYSAGYIFNEVHPHKNHYITDFEKITALLGRKYYEPVIDETIWVDEVYKGKQSEYGVAVSLGKLRYITEWQGTTTTIIHVLAGDNHEITHGVRYNSDKLAPDSVR